MAFIDVAGFVSDMKSHAIDHGFHVHDERHFVETYSLRQLWEVDLHPEEACDGPIDLHLSLEVDPRALLGFEDEMSKLDDPIDSTASVIDAPEHRLSIVARLSVSLADVYANDDSVFCGVLEKCSEVSLFLLEIAPSWMSDT